MAERVMVVCDVCGKSAAETVGISARDKSYRKDLCSEHLAELLKGTRAPRRGRPARSKPASTQPTSAPRRHGRPLKAVAEKTPVPPSGAKRERRKITDPVILEKRRAALVKARKARADKRAAQVVGG
jgi:hypothetical protein